MGILYLLCVVYAVEIIVIVFGLLVPLLKDKIVERWRKDEHR